MTAPVDRVRAALSSRYRIERELGRGATATVYLARDIERERDVAVKVLNTELVEAAGGQRFLREIQMAASLRHPNLVAILDSGEADGVFFYVTPYMARGSLRDRLARERQLSISDAVHITRELATALAYVHSHGIVHRDIKPENILLDGEHACVADFGIARALDRTIGDTITSTGLVVGTPTYMSPEQASGERSVDARSDQYSLASVAYEMIAGVPPFIGATAQAVIAQRFAREPLPLSHYRSTVPEHVESAVARALSLNPADRYPNIERLGAALADPTLTSTAETWGARTSRSLQRRWFAIGAATVVVLLALIGFQAYPRVRAALGPALDTTRFVVLPFDATGAAVSAGATVADGLYAALREWDDLQLVPEGRVQDAIGPRRTSMTSLGEALHTAESFRAGRMIWGRVVATNGDTEVRANLYDVGTQQPMRDTVVILPAGERPELRMAAVVDALLRIPELRRAPEGELGTRNFRARRAFERGEVAYVAGDFGAAREYFNEAVTADPQFARAHLRLALLGMLTGAPPTEWQQSSRLAAAAAAGFPRREGAFASGLLAMAEQRYPEACDSFERARVADSLDFAAWYASGECRALDSLVIRADASPTGWTFRSSHHAAAHSYSRAVQLDSRPHTLPVYRRLRSVLKTEPTQLRIGRSPAGVAYYAYPQLVADTMAFFPVTEEDLARGRYSADPQAQGRALQRARTALLALALDWAARHPGSAHALEAVADVRELRGDIGDAVGSGLPALAAVRRARSLTTDPLHQLELGQRQVRLHVKRGEFSLARGLADSLLAGQANPDPASATVLASLAALLGRASLAARLSGIASVARAAQSEATPQQLARAAAELWTYSALGICTGLEGRVMRVNSLIDGHFSAEQRPGARQRYLAIPARDAVPCSGGRSLAWIEGDPTTLHRLQRAFAAGDTRSVRRGLDSLAIADRGLRPGEFTIDFTYHQAWLRAAIGDTTIAARQLERALEGLTAQPAGLLTRGRDAAGLVRAMALRADLATRQSDGATAKRWSDAVWALWSGADDDAKLALGLPLPSGQGSTAWGN